MYLLIAGAGVVILLAVLVIRTVFPEPRDGTGHVQLESSPLSDKTQLVQSQLLL